MNFFLKKIVKAKKRRSLGFSLLEIVLVLFMVAFVFTGVYVVLAKISKHEKDNRYSLIAANLAQEGVEIIRNKRDENLLAGNPMNQDLSSGNCYPYWSGSTASCDTNKIAKVEIDSGVYRNCSLSGCGSGETIFKRLCDINNGNAGGDKEMLVSCEVEWESPSLGTTKVVEVESFLTNWQEN